MQGSLMALSAKARRVLLRLDDGQMLGCAATLGITGVPSDSAAVLDVDAAFKAGKLPPALVQKLESILRQIAEKVSGNDTYHLRTVNNVIRVMPYSPGSCGHPLQPLLGVSTASAAHLNQWASLVDLQEQPLETQRSTATPRANGHADAGTTSLSWSDMHTSETAFGSAAARVQQTRYATASVVACIHCSALYFRWAVQFGDQVSYRHAASDGGSAVRVSEYCRFLCVFRRACEPCCNPHDGARMASGGIRADVCQFVETGAESAVWRGNHLLQSPCRPQICPRLLQGQLLVLLAVPCAALVKGQSGIMP